MARFAVAPIWRHALHSRLDGPGSGLSFGTVIHHQLRDREGQYFDLPLTVGTQEPVPLELARATGTLLSVGSRFPEMTLWRGLASADGSG